MGVLKDLGRGLLVSLLELTVGILLLIDPVGFTSGIVVAFGLVVMLAGVSGVIRYFRADAETAAGNQELTKGLILLMAGGFGAFCSSKLMAAFPVLTAIYGVMTLITGFVKVQWVADMIRQKRRRWLFGAISAAVSLICGTVIISRPFETTALLWLFTGISLIVGAVFDVVAIIFGNRAPKTE